MEGHVKHFPDNNHLLVSAKTGAAKCTVSTMISRQFFGGIKTSEIMSYSIDGSYIILVFR